MEGRQSCWGRFQTSSPSCATCTSSSHHLNMPQAFTHVATVSAARLTQNMRTHPGEDEFTVWLLQLGNGELNDTSVQPETIKIPPECVCVIIIIYEVFSTSDHSRTGSSSPQRTSTAYVNERVLGILPGEAWSYISANCDNEEERKN